MYCFLQKRIQEGSVHVHRRGEMDGTILLCNSKRKGQNGRRLRGGLVVLVSLEEFNLQQSEQQQSGQSQSASD